jgi:outer membrane protein OmpA-like peptidoglycan-associated protein
MFLIRTGRWQLIAAFGLLMLSAVAQPAAAAENVMIFFDAGKTQPPPSAKQLVAVIAKIIKPNGRVAITGHCDTAEKDAGKLSLARAMAVQKAIVDAGAPAGVTYTTVGKAASALQQPTGPNVAEARNRFVVVTVE